MNRRLAIMGLDIFVLLSLPILMSGRPARDLRPRLAQGSTSALSVAYAEQVNEDYERWVEDQMRALRGAYESEGETAETTRKQAEALDEATRGRSAYKERAGKLSQDLRRRKQQLRDLAEENEALRTGQATERAARLAGLVEAARGRIGMVTGEFGEVDKNGEFSEVHRSIGMVVPVRFGKHVRLVVHVSALGLTDELFGRGTADAGLRLSHLALGVPEKDGQVNWATRIRFFRHEQELVVIETEREPALSAGAFAPSPRAFLSQETIIVLAADGTHYECRFAAREGYIKLTAFRRMELDAKWIRTSQQSPAAAGDVVMDHEGNVVAILVSPVAGYILPTVQRLENELDLDPALRTRTADPNLPAKRRVIARARALNEWLAVQESTGHPYKRKRGSR